MIAEFAGCAAVSHPHLTPTLAVHQPTESTSSFSTKHQVPEAACHPSVACASTHEHRDQILPDRPSCRSTACSFGNEIAHHTRLMEASPDFRRAPTPNDGQPPASTSAAGHEAKFVKPSDYLRPRTLSRPAAPPAQSKPERPIDRDERLALVSLHNLHSCSMCSVDCTCSRSTPLTVTTLTTMCLDKTDWDCMS